ncbi:hypothetical protein D3C72_494160 [compost metagenome]
MRLTSAKASSTVPNSPSRAVLPPPKGIGIRRSSSTVATEPTVRMPMSPPASSLLPPGKFRFSERSCALTNSTLVPMASRRAGESRTRISRDNPPSRLTEATPGTVRSARVMSSSISLESSPSVRLGLVTV